MAFNGKIFVNFKKCIEIVKRRITEWSRTHDNSALLGIFSAAARYAPTVRYKKVEFMLNNKLIMNLYEIWN